MKISDTAIQEWKDKIAVMSHEEMCRLWRTANIGHPVFNIDYPIYEYFKERYKDFGGMTPEMSKKIGF
jgi:hypothetical protein